MWGLEISFEKKEYYSMDMQNYKCNLSRRSYNIYCRNVGYKQKQENNFRL